MALISKDRVVETSTSTGTGDFTLAGAVVGFRAFSSVCSTSDTFHYMIEAVDASGVPTGEWETGYGTYSAANTLTRTAVMDSSTGSAVNFAAGTKRVTISPTNAYLSYRGCLAYKGSAETALDFTVSGNTITFDTEEHDTDNFHSYAGTVTITIASPGVLTWTGHGLINGTPMVLSTTGALPTGFTAGTKYFVVNTATNTFQLSATSGGAAINTSGSQSGTHTATTHSSILRVPHNKGITKVEVNANIFLNNGTASAALLVALRKNAVSNTPGLPNINIGYSGTDNRVPLPGNALSVTDGDWFDVFAIQQTDTSIDLQASRTWFGIKVVD